MPKRPRNKAPREGLSADAGEDDLLASGGSESPDTGDATEPASTGDEGGPENPAWAKAGGEDGGAVSTAGAEPPSSPVLRLDKPGIYSLTAEEYHADPCIVPSFSRSIAKLLIECSPAHARYAHPRLGVGVLDPEEGQPDGQPGQPTGMTAQEARDVGTAAHAAFLRGESVVVKVDVDAYTTKAARQQRDEILAAGRFPLKRAKFDDMLRLLEVLERFRAATGAFTNGKPEQTLLCRLGPSTWARCMVDWLEDDPSGLMWDLKTTAGRAHVDGWTRRCFETGGHLQAVLYPMLAAELRDGEVPSGFRYVVVEQKPPFGIKAFELSPQAFEIAEAQLRYALHLWERCMTEGFWPGYPVEPEWIDPPGWLVRQWEWQTRTGQGMREASTGVRPENIDRFVNAGQLGG